VNRLDGGSDPNACGGKLGTSCTNGECSCSDAVKNSGQKCCGVASPANCTLQKCIQLCCDL
jgi:hypothetical protein